METILSGTECRCGTCDYCRATRTARKDARHLDILQPDLELVAVPRDESFKAWSQAIRTARCAGTSIPNTRSTHYVRRRANSSSAISSAVRARQSRDDRPEPAAQLGQQRAARRRVAERCLIVQFEPIHRAGHQGVPGTQALESLLERSRRGVLFTRKRAPPPIRSCARCSARKACGASSCSCVVDLLCRATSRKLASAAYLPDPARYAGRASIMCCPIIGKNLSQELRETELARTRGTKRQRLLAHISGVIRACRFVQYVNRLRINLAASC